MKLITKKLETKLLAAGKQNLADPVPLVKFFFPIGGATWLICTAQEIDEEFVMYGLCDLGMGYPEIGTVKLSDLESIEAPFGLKIERALYGWKAGGTISEYLIKAEEAGRIVEIFKPDATRNDNDASVATGPRK